MIGHQEYKLKYFLIALLVPVLTLANIDSHFKKFKTGPSGQWESVTTVLVGPQKGKELRQKSCVNEESQKLGASVVAEGSKMMPNCETKVILDTAEKAESLQVCQFGQMKTTITMVLKKTSATSYQTEVESKQNGAISKTKTLSKFVGPCGAKEKIEQKKNSTEACQKCQEEMKSNKKKCENTNNPQEKMMCQSMLGQIDKICQMSCSQ